MKRSIKLVFVLAPCLALLFGGCSASKPRTGLTTMLWSIPSSLKPWDGTSQDDFFVVQQLYDGLFDLYHQNPKDVRPCLAEKFDVSPDNLTYTYYLRKGVKFHNGDEMTSDDVVYSLNAVRVSPATSIFAMGFKDVEAVDRYTVKLTLKYPVPNLNAQLGSYYYGIVCKKAMEEFKGTDKSVVGTGPYKLKALNSGESLELVANEEYFQGPPKIKSVTYRQIADTNAGTIAFLNGEIDLDVTPPSPDFIASEKDKKVFTMKSQRTNLRTLAINNASGPLKDVRVRQAICYAIDPVAINEMAHDGVQLPAYQATPAGIEGHIEGYKPYVRDVEKAKALLAEAGYSKEHPLSLTLTYMAEGAVPKDATAIQAQLLEAGIQVKGLALEQQAWLQAMYSRKYEIGYYEYYYAPSSSYLTYQNCFSTKGYFNIFSFSDPDVDEWARVMSTELDQATRSELAEKINRRLMEKGVLVPLLGVYQLVMANPKLKGLYFDPQLAVYKVYDMYWE